MEVVGIKEGALRVYSGQRLFPLTFQMPESGLALKERRWHASRKGGNVTLGSIAATDLEVYTCGALVLRGVLLMCAESFGLGSGPNLPSTAEGSLVVLAFMPPAASALIPAVYNIHACICQI